MDKIKQQFLDLVKGTDSGPRLRNVTNRIIPINDLKMDSEALLTNYVENEHIERCKLAALYRLVDIFGWSQATDNHITVRVSQENNDHFLLNPYGLHYSEVTASSLIKVDVKGNIIDRGTTKFGIALAGFVLHSAIHSFRPDAKCIVHIHYPSCVAVSAMKCGLLPLSQESVYIGGISYHPYNGVLIDTEERELISKSLGPTNQVMFLRNHGLVVLGETIEEAFWRTYYTVLACEAQIRMMPVGLENLMFISEEAQRKCAEDAKNPGEYAKAGQGSAIGQRRDEGPTDGETEIRWKLGDMEFEAYMRILDNMGYKTGYPFRIQQPTITESHNNYPTTP